MPVWAGEAAFPRWKKYSARGLSRMYSSVGILTTFKGVGRTPSWSANPSVKLSLPELLMRPSLVLAGANLDYAARGTVTETVVPGDAADVATRPPSCRASASTILVPRPALAGASANRVLIPTPSSETARRHARSVDSKPTTILPLAPPGKACFNELSTSSVVIRPMLTACSEVVAPSPASTLRETG